MEVTYDGEAQHPDHVAPVPLFDAPLPPARPPSPRSSRSQRSRASPPSRSMRLQRSRAARQNQVDEEELLRFLTKLGLTPGQDDYQDVPDNHGRATSGDRVARSYKPEVIPRQEHNVGARSFANTKIIPFVHHSVARPRQHISQHAAQSIIRRKRKKINHRDKYNTSYHQQYYN